MKVLLPLDIVHPLEPTIMELTKLVDLAGCEVKLLYVKEELPSYERVIEASADFKDDWTHQIEERAGQMFAQARAALEPAGARVSVEIVTGPPAMMIEAVARDEKMEITALKPGKHSQVEKFLLGRVSSKVVKHGPGTVLILRPSALGEDPLRHVVAAIDGSQQSRQAISQAAVQFQLGKRSSCVHLVHVVSVADVLKLISPVEYIATVENNLLLEGETFLAEGKRILADSGVTNVQCVLKEGDPATEIINLPYPEGRTGHYRSTRTYGGGAFSARLGFP